MTRIIAITNRKGGVGKTSTAHALGFGLAALGRRVLLIDLDTQGHLSAWSNVPTDALTLADVAKGDRALSEIVRPVADGVDIIPGSDALVVAEATIQREGVPQTWLRRMLKTLRLERWDYVIMDSSPAIGDLWSGAIVAASDIIAPVEATGLGIEGTAELLLRIRQLEELNPSVKLLGVLPIRYDARKRIAREALEVLKDLTDDAVLPPIRENVRIAEAFGHRESIFEYDTRCAAAEDYRRLAGVIDHG